MPLRRCEDDVQMREMPRWAGRGEGSVVGGGFVGDDDEDVGVWTAVLVVERDADGALGLGLGFVDVDADEEVRLTSQRR